MAKYVIDGELLERLANAIRVVNGQTRTYTPSEMIDAVSTILEDGAYILVDAKGNEVPAVFVDNEVVFTATANDIRIGTTAVTEAGVTEGTKEIPSYHTSEGYRVIAKGNELFIPHARYDYTKLQAIVCAYNTTLANSVAAEKVVISDGVYDVNSTQLLSSVVKNHENNRIELGITNDSSGNRILRYFMYKEIY